MEKIITVSVVDIQKTFTEWDRRYREDPEAFMNEAARLLQSDADTYGEEATPYFLSVLDDVRGAF